MRLPIAIALVVAAAPSLWAQERLGFRVHAWVQWDDQHIELGHGHVGGPYGLAFTVRARLEGTIFTVKVRPSVGTDSTTYGTSIETRIAVSDSQALTPLFAIDRYYRTVAVKRGGAAQMTLPFHPEPGETADLHLRIEGPFEPRPPDSAGWMNRVIEEPRGVYYRNVAFRAAVSVTPDVCAGALAVRLAAASASEGREVLACGNEASEMVLPGLPGRWIIMIPQTEATRPHGRCLMINEPPPAGFRNFHPHSWAQWCAGRENPWAPVTVRLSTGEVFRAQLMP